MRGYDMIMGEIPCTNPLGEEPVVTIGGTSHIATLSSEYKGWVVSMAAMNPASLTVWRVWGVLVKERPVHTSSLELFQEMKSICDSSEAIIVSVPFVDILRIGLNLMFQHLR